MDNMVDVKGGLLRWRCTVPKIVSVREGVVGEPVCGYATDRCEQGEGVCCVAAPVFDRTGRPLASITVTGLAERFEKLGFEAMGKSVTACAQKISVLLGHVGNGPARKGKP